MTKFNPEETPYIVTWMEGGYNGHDECKTFASLDEAVAAYNGKRPFRTASTVYLRDWRKDAAWVPLWNTCLAQRKFNFTTRQWVRRESRLASILAMAA